jgi:L-rhamnose-H+ transport protein
MIANPLLGVVFHWLGGLASASFYVPYKSIKHWSWEVFWLTGGFFSWIICPWLFASFQTQDLFGVLSKTDSSTLGWCYFWGAMWGLGGLTFGLTMRYLGMSLGMATALGFTAAIGTLAPPIFHNKMEALLHSTGGLVTLAGIAVVLVGIAFVAIAGRSREKEVGANNDTVVEFNLKKGLLIGLFSGVMSACFAFGLDNGGTIKALSAAAGTGPLWVGLPVLCIVLAGGFTTNFVWCLILIIKNNSAKDWVKGNSATEPTPLLKNFLFAALGGTLWYLQFFFYTMGESQMGQYGFSSWTLHMASIILFSTLWGFALKEYQGTSDKTRRTVWLGILTLVAATIIIGFGNKLAS